MLKDIPLSQRLTMLTQKLTIMFLILLSQTAPALAAANDAATRANNPDEGTETHLSPQELASIAVWAKNSQADLKDLLQSTREQSPGQAKTLLVHGIRDVVLASAPKSTEMLMRFALNRAIKAVETMDQSGHSERPGEADQEVRVLTRSIEFALAYYQNDLAYLNSETSNAGSAQNPSLLPYAKFGGEYAQFLMSVNESLINARAQYSIGMMVLGFLQVDLDRDAKKTEYAGAIEKIERMRKLWPDTPPSLDSDSIRGLKEIHKVYFDVIAALQSQGAIPAAPVQTETPPTPKQDEDSDPSGDWIGIDKSLVIDDAKRVFNVRDKAIFEATIIARANDGTVTLEFNSGDLNGQTGSDWALSDLATRSGCTDNICVGQRAYLVRENNTAEHVTIAGLQTERRFVVKFNDGELRHQFGQNWDKSNLAFGKGCSADLCVNQKMFNPKNNAYCTIVAIQPNGRYVIRLDSGDHKGWIGGGWEKSDLAVLQ